MPRTPMTADEITALNRRYEELLTVHPSDAAAAMVATARDQDLTLVQWYDQSGGLYRNDAGRFCFGWETTGGFDTQIED